MVDESGDDRNEHLNTEKLLVFREKEKENDGKKQIGDQEIIGQLHGRANLR